MKNMKHIWVIGLIATLAIIILPMLLFLPRNADAGQDPWDGVPVRAPGTDHLPLLPGPYETGSQVTARCLECHEEAAGQVMATAHWTWESEPVLIPGHVEPVSIGKKNLLNNFCIGIQSNWPGCTSCHAGYGWEDQNFDFNDAQKIDCLVCHDTTGTYVKGDAGYPLEGVDLAYVAQSVGTPNRATCGGCHFDGGGGNGVKHGDLDEHLINPPENLDVHMGALDFVCIDCHATEEHQIAGRSISVSMETEINQVYCTDCHSRTLHADDRINAHTGTVACQTCHIPAGALMDPTKMFWDWSTAGQDLPENPHTYLKIKGSFIYEKEFIPQYFWYAGVADHYLLGDPIDPAGSTEMNTLAGDINDPQALIMPFKVHTALQPYDTVYEYLLQPKTVGEGGFWTDFNWDEALKLGSQVVNLPYSGSYGFASTIMYWPVTHMVASREEALDCSACHGANGRLDWSALGYPGDPIEWGGRFDLGRQP